MALLLCISVLFPAYAGCHSRRYVAPAEIARSTSGGLSVAFAVSTGYQPGATAVATEPPEEPDVFDPTESAPEFEHPLVTEEMVNVIFVPRVFIKFSFFV